MNNFYHKALRQMLTVEKTKSLANLAKIHIRQEDTEKLSAQVNSIISWVEQLDEVDTVGVEPLYSIESHSLTMRRDIVSDGNIRDEILKNTTSKYGYFVVPKVVE
jgi:aspartyl-tRNA(Asn)/glutamyl-tRNA(Gln) amidotransferase subunit C